MKRLHAIFAFLCALLVGCSLFSSVMAAESYTISIYSNDNTLHTYEAYQIFSGRLETADNQEILSDIEWGSSIDAAQALPAIQKISGFASASTASQVAKVLADRNDAATTKAFANAIAPYVTTPAGTGSGTDVITIQVPAVGYYFIKDKDGSQNGTNSASTEFIVKVISNTRVEPKSSVPAAIKKVEENVKEINGNKDPNLASYTTEGKENDVADYCMSDPFSFSLIGTLPENYGSYSSYYYAFVDELDPGFSINSADSDFFKAEAILPDGSRKTLNSFQFKTQANAQSGKTELVFYCDDLKGQENITDSSTLIKVTFKAYLNQNAVIGLPGNVNTSYLEFSNNPNPGHESEKGQTAKDSVIVFTYGIKIRKVDAADETTPLENAQFILQNADGQYAVVENEKLIKWTDDKAEATTLITNSDGLVYILGLDDGDYTLTETKAPTGYNSLQGPQSLTLKAETVNDQYWDKNPSSALKSISINNSTAGSSLQDGTGMVVIANQKGSTLPSTGGQGTKWFIAGGFVIMLIGAFMIITRKGTRTQQ